MTHSSSKSKGFVFNPRALPVNPPKGDLTVGERLHYAAQDRAIESAVRDPSVSAANPITPASALTMTTTVANMTLTHQDALTLASQLFPGVEARALDCEKTVAANPYNLDAMDSISKAGKAYRRQLSEVASLIEAFLASHHP